MHTSRADRTETQQIPVIRPYGPPMHIVPKIESTLDSQDYVSYMRGLVIIGLCIMAVLIVLTVVNFWDADQTSQMNQLQQCMSRINPDPNTNYQLETYKCMNGSK